MDKTSREAFLASDVGQETITLLLGTEREGRVSRLVAHQETLCVLILCDFIRRGSLAALTPAPHKSLLSVFHSVVLSPSKLLVARIGYHSMTRDVPKCRPVLPNFLSSSEIYLALHSLVNGFEAQPPISHQFRRGVENAIR
jgi:hypothetical protein